MKRIDRDTIVVGLDASDCSRRALEWAIDEARRSGRSLLLVTVWNWTSGAIGTPLSLLGHADPYTAGRRILERGLHQAERAEVPVATHLAEGSPASVLAEVAADAAMLVVGRHGQGMARSLLGSVSKGCMRQAQVPLVVIPSDARIPTPAGTAASGARG